MSGLRPELGDVPPLLGAAPPKRSWLCRQDSDRERLVDMEHRIRPLRAGAMGILAAALALSGPWVGWWTLIPLAIAAGGFALLDRGLAESSRPEYRMAAAWLISEVAIAASVALTGGARSPAIAWLAIPVVTLSARFSARGVAAGVGVAAALMVATTVTVNSEDVFANPEKLIFRIAMLGAVALLSMALMQSDLHHRNASVIDPLTSMLNRNALMTRVAELSQQASVAGHPIGVLVGDLDRFKAINDKHGHAVGDCVLRDIAYRLRKHLRAFDLAYRLGGEEFLVLLPGATAAAAAAVAEELRETVASDLSEGIAITMSFGVSACPPGDFNYDRTFDAADQALYAAKRAGRNCVRVNAPSALDQLQPLNEAEPAVSA